MRRQARRRRRGWLLVTGVLVGAAVAQELRKPAGEREWHGTVGGVVPYDFRPPTVDRFRAAWWNPDDPTVLTARDFGVGWALNVGGVMRRLRGATAGS